MEEVLCSYLRAFYRCTTHKEITCCSFIISTRKSANFKI
jgi:hypothetical protein